jgi:hypothetical protein
MIKLPPNLYMRIILRMEKLSSLDAARDIYKKVLEQSKEHRIEGMVAECCQAFYTRAMAKKIPKNSKHSILTPTKEFRLKHGIKNEEDFNKYLADKELPPRFGGECLESFICAQKQLRKQNQLLQCKVYCLEQTVKNNEAQEADPKHVAHNEIGLLPRDM